MLNPSHAPTHFPATDRVIARPWWRRRSSALAALGTLVIVTGAAIAMTLPAAGTVRLDASSLDVGMVTRAPFQDYLPVRAEVIPLDKSFLAAEVAGRVESVEANDGELVRKGQILAHLVNPDVALDVSLQEVEISSDQSQINQQMIDLKRSEELRERDIADTAYALHKAEQELTKKHYLREADLINDVALKSYQDEVAYQQSRLAALKAAQIKENDLNQMQLRQIDKSRADLQRSTARIRDGLKSLLVIAPQDGRLSGFDLKPGQAIKTGDALGEVDSENSYKVKALVDEYYLSRLHTDLTGNAQLHGQNVTLWVSKIFPQVTDGRVTVELEFQDRMPGGLKRGEAVDVKLSLGDTRDAVLVPVGSWLNDSGGMSIFVLNAAGDHADRRMISVGRRNPDFAEILGGVSPGQKVVIGGTQRVTQAQHLQIVQGQQP